MSEPGYDPSKETPEERMRRFTWEEGDVEFLNKNEADELLGRTTPTTTTGEQDAPSSSDTAST